MGMGKRGDVEYTIRGDDSLLEKDILEANKKVESAAKKGAEKSVDIEQEKTKEIQSENKKVVKSAEKTADDVAEAFQEAGDEAKSALADVEFEDKDVNVDISVDADTSKAESSIDQVSKDKDIDVNADADVSKAESEIKSLEDVAGTTGKNIGEELSKGIGDSGLGTVFENLGGVAKDAFGKMTDGASPAVGVIGEIGTGLSGASLAAVGAAGAVVGIGAMAVSTANDMKGAMNDFAAATGLGAEETARYQGILEDVYSNNYGESFEDIAGAMSNIRQQIGPVVDGWDDAAIQEFTESAFALRDTFGYDIQETVRATSTMMEQFGYDGLGAMDLIAKGAQNGLDFSGELLDSINEYSVQFQKVGFDADDMFKIMEKGAETGAWNLDKIGDAIKEMSIRVIDGSDSTKTGFETIGLNADEMAAKFGQGGDAAKEAFNQTVAALASLEDPLAQDAAGVALFGTMWEDLGPNVVTALADIEDGAYSTGEAMEGIKNVKYEDLGSMFEELKRSCEMLLLPLGESLMPLLMTLAESVLPVVTEVLTPLLDIFSSLVTPILDVAVQALQPLMAAFIDLVNIALVPLMPIINTLTTVFSSAMTVIGSMVTTAISTITNVFRNLIDFIKNVFTGNWKAAWQNVKDIFSNIISGLGAIFKAPLNFIIDGMNTFINGINSLEIPDWVQGVGGKSLNIPNIPRLKIGMDYVPSDFFPAFLDEGEAVLTKEENMMFRSLGGVAGMLSTINGASANEIRINVENTGDGIDYERLGDETAAALIRAGITFKIDEHDFARLVKEVK